MKPHLMNFTFTALQDQFKSDGKSAFLAKQVFDWIYRKIEFNIDNWSNVSKVNREYLKENYNYYIPRIVWDGLSRDGTRKFLIRMHDQNTIETVAIAAKSRLTLCISSQVGCAIGCTFCHTGTQGLTRHLETYEIVGQYIAVTRWLRDNVHEEERLTNIVYMGQGEPLHNFENVKVSADLFLEDQGLGLGQRRVTLSTSGLVPQIEKLFDFPPVNLAISLHSARNETRSELMPINKAYNIERLFEAISKVPLKAHRRITYEYLLIDGLNDQVEDIMALSNLLKRKESKINLIPFNEYPESHFKQPSKEKVLWFMDQLIKRGFTCTIRATKGDDILAACGQLKSEFEKLNLWGIQGETSSSQLER